MRKLMMAMPVTGLLLLASCTPADMDKFIADVQMWTARICSIVPVAANITTLVLADNPIVPVARAVAEQICQATAQQAPHVITAGMARRGLYGVARRSLAPVVVNVHGVPVTVVPR